LWYARFKPDVKDFPKGIWPTYALWQFSSEIRVQKLIPGTDPDIDVNVYNGSVDALRSAWPLTKAGATGDTK
jgi:GH25 family lysozyme M1 (1,4-beta-N-acetylmuramidase)